MESGSSSGVNVETTHVPNLVTTKLRTAVMWISGENVSDFTEAVKNESKCNSRYCQKDWLEKIQWLMYHREKRGLFCNYCNRFADNNVSSPFIFRFDCHDNIGFRNWKKRS